MDADTDLLLALVRSLLPPALQASLPGGALLTALADADGEVERAADALRRGGAGGGSSATTTTTTSARKRAREGTVVDWLKESTANKKQQQQQVQPSSLGRSTLSSRSAAAPSGPSSTQKPSPSLPPLVLATPVLLAQHLPCVALPPSPLPASLASALYLWLMEDSQGWRKNLYVINGREVESPHTTAYFQSAVDPPYGPEDLLETARFWNNNVASPPLPVPYPPLLEQAAQLVEHAVNEALDARPDARKFAGEWQGRWKAGIAGINRYEGAASGVGPHADQLTYLGPYPTIASLSLGTARKFRLRQVPSKDPSVRAAEEEPRTYDVPLSHNTLLLMVPPCQEKFKHSIPQQKSIDAFRPSYDLEQRPIPPGERRSYNSRIAITFRFYRSDFAPTEGVGVDGRRRMGTPVCGCGLPATLKADQRNTVALPRHSPPSHPPAPSSLAHEPPTALTLTHGPNDPYTFYWSCTRRAGGAGLGERDAKRLEEAQRRVGCGFFRVLDMPKEGRDCGVGDGGRGALRSSLNSPLGVGS